MNSSSSITSKEKISLNELVQLKNYPKIISEVLESRKKKDTNTDLQDKSENLKTKIKKVQQAIGIEEESQIETNQSLLGYQSDIQNKQLLLKADSQGQNQLDILQGSKLRTVDQSLKDMENIPLGDPNSKVYALKLFLHEKIKQKKLMKKEGDMSSFKIFRNMLKIANEFTKKISNRNLVSNYTIDHDVDQKKKTKLKDITISSYSDPNQFRFTTYKSKSIEDKFADTVINQKIMKNIDESSSTLVDNIKDYFFRTSDNYYDMLAPRTPDRIKEKNRENLKEIINKRKDRSLLVGSKVLDQSDNGENMYLDPLLKKQQTFQIDEPMSDNKKCGRFSAEYAKLREKRLTHLGKSKVGFNEEYYATGRRGLPPGNIVRRDNKKKQKMTVRRTLLNNIQISERSIKTESEVRNKLLDNMSDYSDNNSTRIVNNCSGKQFRTKQFRNQSPIKISRFGHMDEHVAIDTYFKSHAEKLGNNHRKDEPYKKHHLKNNNFAMIRSATLKTKVKLPKSDITTLEFKRTDVTDRKSVNPDKNKMILRKHGFLNAADYTKMTNPRSVNTIFTPQANEKNNLLVPLIFGGICKNVGSNNCVVGRHNSMFNIDINKVDKGLGQSVQPCAPERDISKLAKFNTKLNRSATIIRNDKSLGVSEIKEKRKQSVNVNNISRFGGMQNSETKRISDDLAPIGLQKSNEKFDMNDNEPDVFQSKSLFSQKKNTISELSEIGEEDFITAPHTGIKSKRKLILTSSERKAKVVDIKADYTQEIKRKQKTFESQRSINLLKNVAILSNTIASKKEQDKYPLKLSMQNTSSINNKNLGKRYGSKDRSPEFIYNKDSNEFQERRHTSYDKCIDKPIYNTQKLSRDTFSYKIRSKLPKYREEEYLYYQEKAFYNYMTKDQLDYKGNNKKKQTHAQEKIKKKAEQLDNYNKPFMVQRDLLSQNLYNFDPLDKKFNDEYEYTYNYKVDQNLICPKYNPKGDDETCVPKKQKNDKDKSGYYGIKRNLPEEKLEDKIVGEYEKDKEVGGGDLKVHHHNDIYQSQDSSDFSYTEGKLNHLYKESDKIQAEISKTVHQNDYKGVVRKTLKQMYKLDEISKDVAKINNKKFASK